MVTIACTQNQSHSAEFSFPTHDRHGKPYPRVKVDGFNHPVPVDIEGIVTPRRIQQWLKNLWLNGNIVKDAPCEHEIVSAGEWLAKLPKQAVTSKPSVWLAQVCNAANSIQSSTGVSSGALIVAIDMLGIPQTFGDCFWNPRVALSQKWFDQYAELLSLATDFSYRLDRRLKGLDPEPMEVCYED